MNLYPSQLRRIADLCDALDKVEESSTDGYVIGIKGRVPVIDFDDPDTVLGYVEDEDGVGYSFAPIADSPAQT